MNGAAKTMDYVPKNIMVTGGAGTSMSSHLTLELMMI